MEKVVVAHPGKQHSYKTAAYLYKAGKLCGYITSVYNVSGSITNILYKLSKGSIKKKIGSHYSNDIPKAYVHIKKEWQGILALILPKLPVLKNYYGKWNNHLNDVFANSVIDFVKMEHAGAVISYDYNSALLFEQLKIISPDIIKILDVSITTRPYMQEIFRNDYEITKEVELIEDYPEIWNKENLDRVYREISNTDFFLVPSQVVRRSLLFCGADDKKIKVVPYGVDCSKFTFKKRKIHDGPIKLIFVGSVNHRKGIHHLLSVVCQFSKNEVDLKLVGGFDQNGSLYKRYSNRANIHFCGFATHDILVNLYHDSDVFVLPSLGEGMAMVILEAMSSGLPVIVSDHTGGNDAITNGVEGFEFAAGDDDQLYEKIKWFVNHKDKIAEMGKKAREKAETYTWDRYGERLCQAIEEIMGEKK